MTLSDWLWKHGLFNHNMLRFSRPKLGRKENKGSLVEDQEVFYGDRLIGTFDKETDKFRGINNDNT